ncbi:MAG TPA: SigB/SigF/SigG family RNA polymerase sigma factor [Baekduia sp.]|nr:SigB/SigF/SigG family RNA polymerase sigma factor [Baekduia sp.]
MGTASLSAEDVRDLLARWREEGDVRARDEVVQRMMPLTRSLARRYANKGEPLEDLEQVASVGLLKAIERFDLDRDVRFATFAVPTIAGEIKRHFRDRGWMLRVPRDVQELAGRLSGVREGLTCELGRSPTVAELAQAAGAGQEQVVEALCAGDAYRTLSLDEPLGEDGEALDAIGCDDDGFRQAEHRVVLHDGLAGLPEREREILRLRFSEGLTQREIADEVGISQMHVSRLLRRSVEHLRVRLAVDDSLPLAA